MKIRINKPLFISVAALVLSSSVFAKPASAEITASVSDTLIIMREEEKVARDTYRELSAQWGLVIFENISKAEQMHMNVIGKLLEKYGIADPVSNDTTGIFVNEDLRAIYQGLLERGLTSSIEALQVGAFVEEFDIRDLKQAADEATEDDLVMVYENLIRASRNHLRAFVRQIEDQGVVYQAQVLSMKEVDAIVNSDMERGNDGMSDNHHSDNTGMDQNDEHQGNTNQDSNDMNTEVDADLEDKMKEDHDMKADVDEGHEDNMKKTEEEREEQMKKAQEEQMKKAQEKRDEARKNAKKQFKFDRDNRRTRIQQYRGRRG